MDLLNLEIFQSVARNQSISGAAKELQYAQSNITTRIQQLEAKFETTLFYRHNRGVTLTDKGHTLLAYSERILNLIEEMNNEITDSQTIKGKLNIGYIETTVSIRLPKLISKFHKNFPEVELTLTSGTSERNFYAVLQHELDGAFIADAVYHDNLIQTKFVDEELILITNAQVAQDITLDKLDNCTILVFHKGCAYRKKLEDVLHSQGIIPKKTMEFGSLDAIMGCVSAGLGVAMMPRSLVKRYISNGSDLQHIFPEFNVNVTTMFIHRKDKYIPSALLKLLGMIKKDSVL